MKRFFIKILIFLIFAGALIVFGGSYFFQDRYFPNTKINGIDVSYKKEADALKKIFIDYNKGESEYYLIIIADDGSSETIAGSTFDYKIEPEDMFYDILKSQNKYLWPLSYISDREYKILFNESYNEKMLLERVSQLKCVNNEDAIEPENAYIHRDSSGYRIAKEKQGTIVDIDKLQNKVLDSVKNRQSKIDLRKDKIYKEPELTMQSQELKDKLEKYRKLSNFEIIYTFGSQGNEVVDFKTYNEWLTMDMETEEVTANEDLVKEYVKSLAKKYDTLGTMLPFMSTLDGLINVQSETYGWKINIDETTNQLIELLKKGETIEVEPVYKKKAMDRGIDCIGDRYIEISLKHQHMWFYKDGECIVDTPVITGKPTPDRETHPGVFFLVSREKERVLGTFAVQGYESFVNYWMPFNGGQGIHDATWRVDSEFNPDEYKTNGSHGCVNTPLENAKKIYENSSTGYPVIVY